MKRRVRIEAEGSMRGKSHTRNGEPAAWNATMTRMAFTFVMAGLVGWAYEAFICGPLDGIGIDRDTAGWESPF